MAGEQIVTLSASGFTSVEIWTTKLDHNLDKPIIDIQLTDNKDTMDTNKDSLSRWESFLIDIGRVKEIITVQGFLADDSSTSALTKKENLFKIVGNSRNTTITWGTDTGGGSQNKQTRSGNATKIGVTETPGKMGTQGPTAGDSGEKMFAVQLALIVGGDK